MSTGVALRVSVEDNGKQSMRETYSLKGDPETSSVRSGVLQDDARHVGFFGAAADAGGKQYRTLGRWKTFLVFIHIEIGLGILSLPSVCVTLGIIPGLITILGIGLLATYTPYIYLQFWRRHQSIDNVADLLRVLGGNTWGIIGSFGWILNLTLTCASAALTMSVAFNTLSGHTMCTVAFVGFPVLICYALTIPRSMNFVANFSGPATIGIIAPIFIVIISLAISRPQQADPGWHKEMHLFGSPTFREGLTAILSVLYASGGRQAFLTVMAEMENPSRDFMPALTMLQTFAIPLYMVTAGAIYGLAGQYVTSPALGSAPLIPAKAAYGIALVTLFNTGMFYGHSATKFLYVVAMRDFLKITDQATKNTVKTWSIWVGFATIFWIVVFIIANAIPVFNNIIAVSSALLVSWFSFGVPAICWLQLHWQDQFKGWKMTVKSLLHYLIVVGAAFLNVAGMWAAIEGLIVLFNTSAVHGPFTCADNSLF